MEDWNTGMMEQQKNARLQAFEKSFYPSFPRRLESRGVSKGPGFLLSQE